MSYDDYDADYYPPEDQPDYNQDYYPPDDVNEFENMFNNAVAKEDFLNIIEMEISSGNDVTWSFKSLEQLCKMAINENNIDEFSQHFERMSGFYEKVNYCDKENTIRDITFAIEEHRDNNLSVSVLRFMLNILVEKNLDREVMDTGLLLARSLFNLDKNQDLGDLLTSLFGYYNNIPNVENDESYNQVKLELLVFKLQYLNTIGEYKQCRKLFVEADKLKQKCVMQDERLNSIVDEEGGKFYMGQKNYPLALEKFKQAFTLFKNSGNVVASKRLLKFSILTGIISKGQNIANLEEVKHYNNDPQLLAIVELHHAFQDLNFKLINDIWFNNISKNEDEPFIRLNSNEIFHNIRLNFVASKIQAYKVIKFTTLEKELSLDNTSLLSLLFEVLQTDNTGAKLNLIDKCVAAGNEHKPSNLKNFDKWMNYLRSSN